MARLMFSSLDHEAPPIRLSEPETRISDPQFSGKDLYCVRENQIKPQVAEKIACHDMQFSRGRESVRMIPAIWTDKSAQNPRHTAHKNRHKVIDICRHLKLINLNYYICLVNLKRADFKAPRIQMQSSGSVRPKYQGIQVRGHVSVCEFTPTAC